MFRESLFLASLATTHTKVIVSCFGMAIMTARLKMELSIWRSVKCLEKNVWIAADFFPSPVSSEYFRVEET